MRPALAFLAALLAPLAGASLPGAIQPGALDEASGCTLNFVYDGTGPLAGRVFIGTAAHCVEVGDAVRVGGRAVGTVVYRGDGDRANAIPGAQFDFALVEVLPAFHDAVVPDVAGHPGKPTGVKPPAQAKPGDLVLYSGHGLGFHLHDATRENRTAPLCFGNGGAHWRAVAGLVSWGDSGGPVLHQDGRALGSVEQTRVGGGGCPAVDEGPTTQAVLAELPTYGWPVALRPAS